MSDLVDRVLRDHNRYSGDGLASEPVGAPLPVGDPASGIYHPGKADFRAALNDTVERADGFAADAAASAVEAAANSALYDPTLRFINIADLQASMRGPAGDGTLWQAGMSLLVETDQVSAYSTAVTDGGVKLIHVPEPENGFGLLGNFANTARTPSATSPDVVASFGGKLFGVFADKIYSKDSETGSWVLFCNAPNANTVRFIVPMADGGVVYVTSVNVFKTNNWGPAATWTSKVSNSGGSAVFLEYSTAGSEGQSKMIVGEYAGGSAGVGWDSSIKAWITYDSGETWSVGYDASILYPLDFGNTHIHGCCYDPWQDLFFLIEGHTANRGVYYNADPIANPAGWTKIIKGPMGNGVEDGQPTNIVPTDQGIVLASDGPTQGFWSISRGATPADMAIQQVWEWPHGGGGIVGFGRCHFRDPTTGVVYFGFTHNYVPDAINPLAIFACDGVSGGIVWRGGLSDIPTVGTTNTTGKIVVSPWGSVEAQTTTTSEVGDRQLSGKVSIGAGNDHLLDPGRVLGGIFSPVVASSRGAAIGAGAKGLANSSLTIGPGSQITPNGSGGTLAGVSSKIDHVNGTVFGSFSETAGAQSILFGTTLRSGANSVVVGALRNLSAYSNVTSVGAIQTVTGTSVVAVGHNTKAEVSGCVAIGTFSEVQAAATGGTVLGHNSKAKHIGATVIGGTLESTAAHQVKLGPKHIELDTAAAFPTGGGAGTMRMATRVNGGGKQELCVVFPTGAVQVIATEP